MSAAIISSATSRWSFQNECLDRYVQSSAYGGHLDLWLETRQQRRGMAGGRVFNLSVCLLSVINLTPWQPAPCDTDLLHLMSYQLLQIRRERGHCYHPLHTLFSTVLWDLDVAGCSGRINNEVHQKKKKRDSDVHFVFLEVWCSERMLLTLCMCCCAVHLALCLGALAWHL